jgi:NADH:ubiquinone oxidoreductase subunit 5 (subunit L)/multisubunit Na+/H+ antiporter MnhA subunit
MLFKNLMLFSIVVPLVGAFLLPLVGRFSEKARNVLAFLLIALPFAALCRLVPVVLSGTEVAWQVAFGPVVSLSFSADILAVFMGLVSTLISALIVLYSFDYIGRQDHREEYYLMVVLFIGSMMGLIFSRNLIFLYLFWELTAFASWRLIGFFRKDSDIRNANKAFLVTFFGAVVMLVGFLMLWQNCGSFDLSVIRQYFSVKPVSDLIVILVLFGLLSKSAILPFHTWLPDAGVAPSPVTALLHAAVLVKIGVYVFARIFIATVVPSPEMLTAVSWIAAASALVSAGAALFDTNMKRIIAYSTISQISFIFLGLASNTVVGIAGGLLFILMHGISKAGLFLAAGVIEHGVHTKDIREMGGLVRTMPVTAVAFLLCAFSVMGIPPFGGFFSKTMVISSAFQSGHYALGSVFLLGAVMTILYLFRLFNLVFLGDPRSGKTGREGSVTMVAVVAVFAVLSLSSSFFIKFLLAFADAAVRQMTGILS